jgi:type IV secretion system protein VirB3
VEELTQTTLHVAATRPALLWGLPLQLASVFIVAFGMIAVVMHNLLYGAVLVPLWFAAGLLVRRDYNAVRVFGLWLRTSASAFDSHLWGGSSVSPLPVRPSKRARGMSDDAW